MTTSCTWLSRRRVKIAGNLKYDVRVTKQSRVAELIKEAAGGRPIVVAGSTVDRHSDSSLSEEEMVIQAWEGDARRHSKAMLVLAPRHPERFGEVEAVVMEFAFAKASLWGSSPAHDDETVMNGAPLTFDPPRTERRVDVMLLDTIGDLAAVYAVADVAFVGGSMVKRGGHNPLEPAQFGVPVVMGPSYENFRGIVERLVAADGIAIVGMTAGLSTSLRSGRDDSFEVGSKKAFKGGLQVELEAELVRLLTDREAARAMGERGRRVFEEQQGATGRVVAAVVELVQQ